MYLLQGVDFVAVRKLQSRTIFSVSQKFSLLLDADGHKGRTLHKEYICDSWVNYDTCPPQCIICLYEGVHNPQSVERIIHL